MEENRRRGLPISKLRTVMRQARPAIGEAVSNCLVNGQHPAWSVQLNRPRRGEFRFRRKVQAKCDAELALLAIRVFLQFGAAQIRGQIYVRRLHGLSCNSTDAGCNALVKKSRYGIIVSNVTSRTLAVPQSDRTRTNLMPVVPAQRSEMKRVHGTAEPCVSFFTKQRTRLR